MLEHLIDSEQPGLSRNMDSSDDFMTPEMMAVLQDAYNEMLESTKVLQLDEEQEAAPKTYHSPRHPIDLRPIHELSGKEFLLSFRDTIKSRVNPAPSF